VANRGLAGELLEAIQLAKQFVGAREQARKAAVLSGISAEPGTWVLSAQM
jgi:hypothetical protein